LKIGVLQRGGSVSAKFSPPSLPTNHLCTDRQANLVTCNLVTNGFHTNFVADFLQAKGDFTRKTAVLGFRAFL